MNATAQAQPVIDDAKAASRRTLGREDTNFIVEYLAHRIIGANSCISRGFIRAGCPSAWPAKPPHRAVDEEIEQEWPDG